MPVTRRRSRAAAETAAVEGVEVAALRGNVDRAVAAADAPEPPQPGAGAEPHCERRMTPISPGGQENPLQSNEEHRIVRTARANPRQKSLARPVRPELHRAAERVRGTNTASFLA
jgi:hypothetical protein